MSFYDSQFSLSPNQQDLLVAALASNQPSSLNKSSTVQKDQENKGAGRRNGYQSMTNDYFNPSPQKTGTSGQFLEADDSPYLGYDLDADGDDQFDFDNSGQLIDDLPGDSSQVDSNDLHDKRKSIGDKEDDDDEGGGKRRESEGGNSKKPGRKPLTAEPTTVSRTSRLFWDFLTIE